MDLLFLFPSNFIKVRFSLSVGSGHIESSINYRWQIETGELIACNYPVFDLSVTNHFLSSFSFFFQSDCEYMCVYAHIKVFHFLCFLFELFCVFSDVLYYNFLPLNLRIGVVL